MRQEENELKISESKIIWRWNKIIIPRGLSNIITENTSVNLRNRQFTRHPSWKLDSISSRLAIRAKKEIKEIEIARSKKGLVKKYENNICIFEYNTPCQMRNCFICTQQPMD